MSDFNTDEIRKKIAKLPYNAYLEAALDEIDRLRKPNVFEEALAVQIEALIQRTKEAVLRNIHLAHGNKSRERGRGCQLTIIEIDSAIKSAEVKP